MTKKTAERKKRRTCGAKTRYESLEVAKKAAFAHALWIGGGGEMRAYRCRYCRKFHVGHKVNGKAYGRRFPWKKNRTGRRP